MFAVDDADYTSRNVDLAAAAVNGVLASDAPYLMILFLREFCRDDSLKTGHIYSDNHDSIQFSEGTRKS